MLAGVSPEPRPLSDAEAAFLERCREDLARFFGPGDEVVEIRQRRVAAGIRLEARLVVSGRSGRFSAVGDTIIEAYGRLREKAPAERVGLAFRAVIEQGRRG